MKNTDIKKKDWIVYNLLFVLQHFVGIKQYSKILVSFKTRFFNKIDLYLNKDVNEQQEAIQILHSLNYQDF